MKEDALQRACIALLRYAKEPIWFTAINPVPAKSKAVAGLSKALGMRKGAPDLVIVHRGKFIGVEFKTPRGRLSVEQQVCGQDLAWAGASYTVVRSVEQFQDLLAVSGIPLSARLAA